LSNTKDWRAIISARRFFRPSGLQTLQIGFGCFELRVHLHRGLQLPELIEHFASLRALQHARDR
jgi:hypothetical protein